MGAERSTPHFLLLDRVGFFMHLGFYGLRPICHWRWMVTFCCVASFAAPVFSDELPEIRRLVQKGSAQAALVKVNAHLAAHPDSLEAQFLKGTILARMNDVEPAIAIFTKLTKTAPHLVEPYNNLAVLYARRQDYAKAREVLEEAIKVDPVLAAVTGNLRVAYGRQASEAYSKALRIEAGAPGAGKGLVLLSALSLPPPEPAKPASPVVASAAPAIPPAPVAKTATVPEPAVKPTPTVVAKAPTAGKELAPEPAKAVAVAKTAEKSSAPVVPSAQAEVKLALESWQAAWTKKDMKAYFAAYAPDFKLPNQLTRQDWEKERTARIAGKAEQIRIKVSALEITVSEDLATAKYHQNYRAGAYTNSTTKVIVFTKSSGNWLIKEEKSL